MKESEKEIQKEKEGRQKEAKKERNTYRQR